MRNPIISALVLIATIAAGVRLGGSSNLPSCSALAAETEGGDRSAEYRTAVAAFKDGRLADALSRFQDVMNNTSGSLRLCATNMVGQIHRLQGRPIEARAAFAELARQAFAWKGDRNSLDARRAALLGRLALCYQAEICEQQQAWQDAIGFYAKLQSLETGQISSAERGMESYGEGSARFARMLFRKVPLWLRTIKRRSALGDTPQSRERLARLYWRTGGLDKARDGFEQLLETFPDYPRAPFARIALASLDGIDSRQDLKPFDWLVCPYPSPATTDSLSAESESGKSEPLPGLAVASELTRLDFLIARMPPTSIWRAVLLIEKGWMRFEVARFDEAAALFNEAADLATQSREAWARRIRDYAELSIAVCRLRQGRYVEGIRSVQAVTERGSRGHVQALAGSLIHSFSIHMQDKQAGAKCGVQILK